MASTASPSVIWVPGEPEAKNDEGETVSSPDAEETPKPKSSKKSAKKDGDKE